MLETIALSVVAIAAPAADQAASPTAPVAVPASPATASDGAKPAGPAGKAIQKEPGASSDRTAAPSGNPSTSSDVVVRANRPRGSVIGDIPPERTFNPDDIAAYGVDTIEDLISTLGPQLGSGRGRDDDGPVVLLNGRRVSSFTEIARLPTEAIERMEVLPEEVALKYGYRADQKVVNVVVFERFSSRIGQASVGAPTEGGQSTEGAAASYLRIRGNTRINLDARYSRSSDLLESERDLRQIDDDPTLGRFRTLLPSSRRVELTGTVAGPVLKDVPATLNGNYDYQTGKSLLGIGGTGLLVADTDTRHAHAGATLGGHAGSWQWNSTGNYDRTSTTTLTDTGDPARPRDTARSVDSLTGADVLVSGPLLTLPAGPISTSVKAGVDRDDFDSRSRVGDAEQAASLSRSRTSVQANLDVPIATSDTRGLGWLGQLTASANLRVEHLSDFGDLTTYGFGLNWSPSPRMNLRGSATDERGAPSVAQLGNPLIVTPNVRTFDPARRETVDVTQILGGNRGLGPDRRRVFSLGLTARPFATPNLTIGVDYVDTRIDDPIETFPILTPAIEAAFPERFTRTLDGRLAMIDARPVNFARSTERELRSRISFVHILGTVPPGFESGNIHFEPGEAEITQTKPGVFEVHAKPGSVFESNLQKLGSRVFVNVEHTWLLTESALIRPGTPPLDLLDGDALSATDGRARHEVELQAGIAKRGLGASVTADWRSGTSVSGLGTTGALDFASYATVDLDLFANIGDHLGAKSPRWLKGLRASLTVTNLFDTRPSVRDATGATPLGYQPIYLNPLGRTIGLNLRKMF